MVGEVGSTQVISEGGAPSGQLLNEYVPERLAVVIVTRTLLQVARTSSATRWSKPRAN
jgi:hypothetical protein